LTAVRAYHGKRTIPKAYVAPGILRSRSYRRWVNDERGDPVVTADANADMTECSRLSDA
jgi:hypothetical protein